MLALHLSHLYQIYSLAFLYFLYKTDQKGIKVKAGCLSAEWDTEPLGPLRQETFQGCRRPLYRHRLCHQSYSLKLCVGGVFEARAFVYVAFNVNLSQSKIPLKTWSGESHWPGTTVF